MQLLRKIGFPISLIYGLVVNLRNWCYDVGIFKTATYKTPTVCVGNLSVGGTGKTPMVEFLVSHLKNERKIAVLSRGYGRKSKGFIVAKPTSTVLELGDEPFQIFSKFPDIDFIVDADRRHAISVMEKTLAPDMILLDDAFQHRKVKPDFSILLSAYGHLYCDDWYLPTGNLRDAKKEAKRADIIVVTKCPPHLGAPEKELIRRKIKPLSHQQVLFSFLEYSPTLGGVDPDMSLDDLRNTKFTLVTGIADPKPLISFLEEQGMSFEHLSFGDHHFFSDKEIALFNSMQRVLTTEKDFVRLQGKVAALCYIEVKHQFLGNGDAVLLAAINNFRKPIC